MTFNLLRDAAIIYIIYSSETWGWRISLMFKRNTTQEHTIDSLIYEKKLL